jgi:NAD(P) transhydrogenase subunit beta
MSGAPILLPARHVINLGTLLAIIALTGWFTQDQGLWVIAAITVLAFLIGFLLIIPIGGADMPVVVSMLNSAIRAGRRRRWASRSTTPR